MAPKRRVEAIDLTSDDTPFYSSSSQPRAHSLSFQSQGYADSQGYSSSPHRAPKQPRTAYNQAQRTTSGASQADAIFIEEDEDDASQEVPDATQAYNQQQYDYTLYGTIQAKIVGVRYYSGYATTGEMVVLTQTPFKRSTSKELRLATSRGRGPRSLPDTWTNAACWQAPATNTRETPC
jgi:SWI/SNF-related matrix-associated actin-dependent regulator of chromatin subfamily A3